MLRFAFGPKCATLVVACFLHSIESRFCDPEIPCLSKMPWSFHSMLMCLITFTPGIDKSLGMSLLIMKDKLKAEQQPLTARSVHKCVSYSMEQRLFVLALYRVIQSAVIYYLPLREAAIKRRGRDCKNVIIRTTLDTSFYKVEVMLFCTQLALEAAVGNIALSCCSPALINI